MGSKLLVVFFSYNFGKYLISSIFQYYMKKNPKLTRTETRTGQPDKDRTDISDPVFRYVRIDESAALVGNFIFKDDRKLVFYHFFEEMNGLALENDNF